MIDITDVILLDITKQDILDSIAKAHKNKNFIDNLRDREGILKFDCKVRGYVGEIGIKKFLKKYGIAYSDGAVPTTFTSDVDLKIDGVLKTYTAEIKTSLIPERWSNNGTEVFVRNCINGGDIKIFRAYDTQQPNDLDRDIYIQIYFREVKDSREAFLSQLISKHPDILDWDNETIYECLNYHSLIENTFFVAWIDKPRLVERLNKMPANNRTWTSDKRVFWKCKIAYSQPPSKIILFVHRTCPKCGQPLALIEKNGSYFLGCTGWKRDNTGCSYTSSIRSL